MKILLIILILFSCKQVNEIESEQLLNNVYYSVQKGNMLYCAVYYHFENDSLSVYNSATDQKLKFEINYLTDSIVLNNKKIKDYGVRVLKSSNGQISLIDKLNFININDTINLVNIEVNNTSNYDFKINYGEPNLVLQMVVKWIQFGLILKKINQ